MPKSLRDQKELKDSTDRLARGLDAALALADPAERLYATLEAKDDAERFNRRINDDIADKSNLLAMGVYFASTIGGVLGGLAIAAVAPALGIAVAATGLVLGFGSAATGKADDFFSGRFFKKVSEHWNAAWGIRTRADDGIRAVLETSSTEIAASPKFGKIYDSFPEIRDHFIKTFNQSAARASLGAPAELAVKVTPPAPPAIAA